MNCPMCWMMVPFVILGILVVIGVLALVVFAVAKGARSSNPSAPSAETPLATLKRRYAQGEITPEQFELMKQRLSEGDETTGG